MPKTDYLAKKVAIMQPYLFPYIGYFQLINAVDKFVLYDNIQYTKKGWINRNRILQNRKPEYISYPLKKDSDYLNIVDRFLSDDIEKNKLKLERKIEGAYRKAPFFIETMSLIKKIHSCNHKNLFLFIFNSIQIIKDYLEIETPITISSNLDIDHNLTGADKVIAICKEVKCNDYINPIGGVELYDKKEFKKNDLELKFINSNVKPYKQNIASFESNLSIIDVLMWNDIEEVKGMLSNYKLI